MRNMMKLIAFITVTALLFCILTVCAYADDKIRLAPVFRLPPDRLVGGQSLVTGEEKPQSGSHDGQYPAEADEDEDTEDSDDDDDDEDDEDEDEDEDDDDEDYDDEDEDDEDEDDEDEDDEDEDDDDEDYDDEDEDDDEYYDDDDDYDFDYNEFWSEYNDEDSEPHGPEVRIYSSQREVVTEGEIIELSSKLIGIDGAAVTYQWQVDRGDGLGWVDIEGATREKYFFTADRQTIRYKWRLIINVTGQQPEQDSVQDSQDNEFPD